jgi:hypothetical protein
VSCHTSHRAIAKDGHGAQEAYWEIIINKGQFGGISKNKEKGAGQHKAEQSRPAQRSQRSAEQSKADKCNADKSNAVQRMAECSSEYKCYDMLGNPSPLSACQKMF